MVGMPGFWPGFLALDRRTGGGFGGGGEGGGKEKFSFALLVGGYLDEFWKKNIVFQYYWDGEIQFYSREK